MLYGEAVNLALMDIINRFNTNKTVTTEYIYNIMKYIYNTSLISDAINYGIYINLFKISSQTNTGYVLLVVNTNYKKLFCTYEYGSCPHGINCLFIHTQLESDFRNFLHDIKVHSELNQYGYVMFRQIEYITFLHKSLVTINNKLILLENKIREVNKQNNNNKNKNRTNYKNRKKNNEPNNNKNIINEPNNNDNDNKKIIINESNNKTNNNDKKIINESNNNDNDKNN